MLDPDLLTLALEELALPPDQADRINLEAAAQYFEAKAAWEDYYKVMGATKLRLHDSLKALSALVAQTDHLSYTERMALPEVMALTAKIEADNQQLEREWEISKRLFQIAYDLNGEMLRPAPKPDRPAAPKESPQERLERLITFWGTKADRYQQRIAKAQAQVAKAQAQYQSACGAGGELSQHFHLGTVGGSGRPVQRLNRKRAAQADRSLDLWQKLQQAQSTLSQLELALARAQTLHQRYLNELEK